MEPPEQPKGTEHNHQPNNQPAHHVNKKQIQGISEKSVFKLFRLLNVVLFY